LSSDARCQSPVERPQGACELERFDGVLDLQVNAA
jgi:hypothetical protein